MKFLKYLLGFVILLVIGFIILGFVKPTVTYSSEVVVDKPAAEAWAVMSDEAKLPQWITGYKKSELISGAPNTVGSVSNVYIDNAGTETIIKETITKSEPNKVMAMDFSMDPMDMEYEMNFVEKDSKTIITSTTFVKGKGMFMRSMMALMTSGMKKQEDVNMGKLQNLINQNQDIY